MAITDYGSELDLRVRELVRADFTPHFGELKGRFATNPLWSALKDLGTELWLDTGDIDAIGEMWTQEFSSGPASARPGRCAT